MLHRDLKPENVLLDHASNARLADLGDVLIVKNGGPLRPGEVYSHKFCGTPGYMAPELLTCPQEQKDILGRISMRPDEKILKTAETFRGDWDLEGYGVGADWWAFGCLFWDLLAAAEDERFLFPQMHKTVEFCVKSRANTGAAVLRARKPTISKTEISLLLGVRPFPFSPYTKSSILIPLLSSSK